MGKLIRLGATALSMIGILVMILCVQAAILLIKFRAFQEYELAAINKVANGYREILAKCGFAIPQIPENFYSSWAQYTIQLPEKIDRTGLQMKLNKYGIPTMVYYPIPMHRQKAFMGTDSEKADCPNTEILCRTVLSLPIHPYMRAEDIKEVTNCLLKSLKELNKTI